MPLKDVHKKERQTEINAGPAMALIKLVVRFSESLTHAKRTKFSYYSGAQRRYVDLYDKYYIKGLP